MAPVLLDLETTGLIPGKHSILEIYAKVFNESNEFHGLILPHNFIWDIHCITLHQANGLIADCLSHGQLLCKVMIDFTKWCQTLGTSRRTLAGKAVGRFDFPFLVEAHPELKLYFHHNTIDIGVLFWELGKPIQSLKDLAQAHGLIEQNHRAKDDVLLCEKLLNLWLERQSKQQDDFK